jgi:hypothetical protein
MVLHEKSTYRRNLQVAGNFEESLLRPMKFEDGIAEKTLKLNCHSQKYICEAILN